MIIMKSYFVYFEIYGKKIKAVVEAKSKKEAEQCVRDKISFLKVEVLPNDSLLISLKDIISGEFL